MADDKISLIVQLKDGVSKISSKMGSSLQALKRHWLSITLAIGGVVAAGTSVVKAFLKQEDAVEKLNQALKNQGRFSEKASQDITNYASSLQKITTVGDETIIGQQALLVTFGLTGKELERSTKAALDLSAGLGIDLKAATLLVGKAFAGDISTLSRYGIKIKEGLKESDKFEAVLQKLNSQFGGQAEARLNTFSGRIENLTNRVGDLKERLGKELIPILESWATWANVLITKIEKLTGASQNELSVDEIALEKLREKRDALRKEIELKQILENARIISLDGQRQELESTTRLIAETKRRIEEDKKEAERRSASTRKGKQDTSKAEEAKKKFLEATEKFAVASFDRMASGFGNAMAQTLVYGKSFKQAMESLWKDLAAFVIQELTRMIVKALVFKAIASSIGRPFGGFTPFGQGGAVNLQTGGVVRARPGGTAAIVGEGGRSEAVIPLDDPRTKQRLRDVFGGEGPGGSNVSVGDINVNIDFEKLSTDNAEEVMGRIAQSVRRGTIDGIQLALALKESSDKNTGLAT